MKLAPIYSTISAASIAAAVDAGWAIGPVARCRLFQRGFNDTYELEGADGRRFMARLSHHRFRGPANVAYETALLTHLHRGGIVVGLPVADRDGCLWRVADAPEGPRELVVFERLSGRELSATLWRTAVKADARTTADIRTLGASLAQIHLAGASFDGPASLYRLERPHLLDDPLAQIIAVADDGLAHAARAVGDGLRTRLDARADALSIAHCHGDNHGGNTLLVETDDGTLVAGWFDFDDAGPGFLAYDLATFLWGFLVNTPDHEVNEDARPLWPAFIAGYRSVRPIPAADYDAIGLLVAVRHVFLMGNYASRLPQSGASAFPADRIRSGLDFVREWQDRAAPAVD